MSIATIHGRRSTMRMLSGAVTLALGLWARGALATPASLSPATASASVEAYGLGDPSEQVTVPPDKLPVSIKVKYKSPEDQAPGDSSAAAKIVGGTDPSLIVSAAASGQCGGTCVGNAQGTLDYSFVIVGPTTADAIPVLFRGSNSVAGSLDTIAGGYSSSASVQITTDGNVVKSEEGGNFDDSLSLALGSVYDVAMEADARAYSGDPSGNFSTSAYADPTFAIDPSFAGSSDYSIVFSSGLLSVPVPEPGSLFLFGAGLASLLLLRRRRSASPSAGSAC